jgi:hypothetical protein
MKDRVEFANKVLLEYAKENGINGRDITEGISRFNKTSQRWFGVLKCLITLCRLLSVAD